MKWLRITILSNIRPIVYAFFISLGMSILIDILNYWDYGSFFRAAGFLYIILVLEVGTVWFWARSKLKSLEIPLVDRYDRRTQILMHLIMPSLLYWSSVFFIFVNPNPQFWFIFLVFSFFLFVSLFINIKAYYLDKFKLEADTHYIYDVIKLLIYQLLVFSLFNLMFIYQLNIGIVVLGIVGVTAMMLFLNILRYRHLSFEYVIYVWVNAFLIGLLLLLLLMIKDWRVFHISLIAMCVYYISVSVLHHKIKCSLRFELIWEYGLIALVGLVMFV